MTDHSKMEFPVAVVARPRKWDAGADHALSDAEIDELLQKPPFLMMAEEKAGNVEGLRTIHALLRHECRIIHFENQQSIFQQGEFGNTAYVVLSGSVEMQHADSARAVKPKGQTRKGVLAVLSEQLRRSRHPEVRHLGGPQEGGGAGPLVATGTLGLGAKIRTLGVGEFFGLLGAIRRAPRSSTAISQGACTLLQIRWQGLRDLMQSSKRFKAYCDQLYRERSLRDDLGRIPFIQALPADRMEAILSKAVFESIGKRNWLDTATNVLDEQTTAIAETEPLIVDEGEYAGSVYLVSFGFVRVSQRVYQNDVTVGFLKAGDMIGLREIAESLEGGKRIPYGNSYRAIGYVDLIRIPAAVFEREVAPGNLGDIKSRVVHDAKQLISDRKSVSSAMLEKGSGVLNRLINHRLINGTKAMVINTDLCTGCDDCVRACAAVHDNNPRFIRHGLRVENLMIANACMHCTDALCLIGCPTGAIHRNESGGEVIIEDSKCIGCATCATNCPYQNIRMVNAFDRNGAMYVDAQNLPILKATKCDFCSQQPASPACERACPHGALRRVDLQNFAEIKDWVQS